jgi:plasmid stabilization system protein ParE
MVARVDDVRATCGWRFHQIRNPRRFTTAIVDRSRARRSLHLFPEMGDEGMDDGTYERGVSGTPYIVVYEVRKKPSAVLVIAVLHGARDR